MQPQAVRLIKSLHPPTRFGGMKMQLTIPNKRKKTDSCRILWKKFSQLNLKYLSSDNSNLIIGTSTTKNKVGNNLLLRLKKLTTISAYDITLPHSLR